MSAGAGSRLQEVGRTAQDGVEPAEQAGGGGAEERREGGAGDEVPLFSDRQVVPPVVPPFAVECFVHEDGERDRTGGANPVAEAVGRVGRRAHTPPVRCETKTGSSP